MGRRRARVAGIGRSGPRDRAPHQTWKTELALARLHAAAGRRDAAAEVLAAARRTIEGLRGGVRDARLLAGLTDGPLIRGVFDASPFD